MNNVESGVQWMQRALDLAKLGTGAISPGALVGCVIVKDGEKIGEGAHLEFGGPHAEVLAIANTESNGHSVEGATAYVTLEPCAHFGKTPPCVDLLIAKKVRSVVIATKDPNPVARGGIQKLEEAGINVQVGILESDAKELNRFFFKYTTLGLPYVTLKFAMSLDGRSALKNGLSQWVTSEESRRQVHQMRAERDAILIGSGTALADNPSLTVRLAQGHQPYRVVIDSKLQLPLDLKLFVDDHRKRTIVLTSSSAVKQNRDSLLKLSGLGIEAIQVDQVGGQLDLRDAFKKLADRGIMSILSESGPGLTATLVKNGLFDEIACYIAPKLLGGDAMPVIGALDLTRLVDSKQLKLHHIGTIGASGDVLVVLRKDSFQEQQIQ